MKTCMYRIALFAGFFLFVAVLSAQKISEKQMKKDIEYLASDELEGRDTGSKGEAMAADYVVKRLTKMGATPKGEGGTWFQTFTFTPKKPKHAAEDYEAKEFTGKNVIGYIDHGAVTTVVLGAHFDHLGYGGKNSGSRFSGEGEIHNGADDNASGVSMMLELAKNLVKGPTNNNYLIIAFSGEEKGLWGSNYFTKHPTIDLEKVDYMINMDMVGRLEDEKGLAIYGTGTAENWMEIIEKANTDNLKLVIKESGVGPSDHTSFYLVDKPVLHFFTGQHDDYHTPADDADKINYPGMKQVAAMIYRIIVDLDDELKLEFVPTKNEESRKAPSYTVTLGVMPDYMFDGEGMRIEGVSDGGAASKAGFEKGDIVVKMGETAVSDMMSYVEALSTFKKGDKTVVIVNRDGRLIKMDVEF
jgi:hypothetical protein